MFQLDNSSLKYIVDTCENQLSGMVHRENKNEHEKSLGDESNQNKLPLLSYIGMNHHIKITDGCYNYH